MQEHDLPSRHRCHNAGKRCIAAPARLPAPACFPSTRSVFDPLGYCPSRPLSFHQLPACRHVCAPGSQQSSRACMFTQSPCWTGTDRLTASWFNRQDITLKPAANSNVQAHYTWSNRDAAIANAHLTNVHGHKKLSSSLHSPGWP